MPIMVIYAWAGLIGAAVLAPVTFAFEAEKLNSLTSIPARGWMAVVFSAICSTLIGQGGMAWLLQRHPISMVIPFTLLSPVVSVIAGALVFKTPVTGLMLLGGVTVLGGVAIVTMRTAQKAEEFEGTK